jgi:hypothetical protein
MSDHQRTTRRRDGDSMNITSIEMHAGSGMWHGTATHAGKHLLWYFRPRSWLHVQEQDDINPRCWMNVDAPQGMRQIILKAIRTAA